MTAPTPLHGVIVTVAAVIAQIAFIVTTFNNEQISSTYQCFIVLNNVLISVLLTLAVIFGVKSQKIAKNKRPRKKEVD